MTGFGEGTAGVDGASVAVTLRSVNHRSLDLSVRLRDEYRGLEGAVRTRLGESLGRGRVECQVEVTIEDSGLREAGVDRAAIERYLGVARELRGLDGVTGELGIGDLLRLPDVVRPAATSPRLQTAVAAALNQALAEAIEGLIADREREGAALAAVIGAQVEALEALVAALQARAPESIAAAREALQLRIREGLGDLELDPQRLAQEAAILADRADIREELDRLVMHLPALREALSSDQPVGKRLEVLLQEVLRELSTTGAKSRDAELKRLVVEARLLTESAREQVSNVE
jgi:uncharacterized protein (TIGR00255 family)